MFYAIVIDDDEISRSLISEMIQNYFPEIKIAAEAGSFYAGVKEIHKHCPDIVFLDMELPDGKGYEIFEMSFNHPFKVIFITGFRDYAYLAINHSPAGYILKPISVCNFVNAVHKAIPQIALPSHANDELPKPDPLYSSKIVIKTIENIFIIPKNKIIRCEACRNYTIIFQEGEKDILASQTLKDFESMLVYPQFLRVHQSHLVNTDFIKRIDKMDCSLLLTDNTHVPIAYRKREYVMDYIKSICE